MLEITKAFLKKDFRQETSYKLAFLMTFMGMFFSVLTYYFLGKLVPSQQLAEYGGNYFAFVLIGVAFMGFLGLMTHGFAGFLRRSQLTGTLESMIVTPTKTSKILLNSLIWSVILVILHSLIYLIFGVFVFKISFNINFLSTLIIFFLSMICFAAIGIASAALIIVFKQGNPIAWLFTTFSGLLAGTMYPVKVLPLWMQKIAYLIPLTYSLRAMRLTVLQGYSLLAIRYDLLVLALFAIILLPISLFIFKIALRKAKKEGSLVKY